jgi:2'-5' RNA ligase
MNNIRRQLTLFLDDQESESIEQIRNKFNPEQYQLIKAHVTLCREDEIEDLTRVLINLEKLSLKPIAIHFENPIRFSEGKGVMLLASDNNNEFQVLRKQILTGIIENPRNHKAHITLMHPRNSECTDEIFEEIEQQVLPRSIEFKKMCLIEQREKSSWVILREFYL